METNLWVPVNKKPALWVNGAVHQASPTEHAYAVHGMSLSSAHGASTHSEPFKSQATKSSTPKIHHSLGIIQPSSLRKKLMMLIDHTCEDGLWVALERLE